MTIKHFAVTVAAIFGLLTAAATPIAAQDKYPSRTVTIVTPYPAGGPTDLTARVLAQSMQAQFGQSFIVENISGGNTIVACEKIARSAPNGYMLLLHNLQISANTTLLQHLPFDTMTDFAPVMLINRNPLVLVGRPTLPASNLKELIALMKKQRLRAAIPPYGSTGHLATTLFAQRAGVQLDEIPYRGATPAISDLLGGQVDLFFATPQSIVQLVNTGKLKALGMTSKERLPELPNVDSLVDALGPKLDFVYWQALFAPGKTPRPVITALNAAMQKAVSDPAIAKTWAAEGVSVFPPEQRSPEAAETFLKSEIARWGEVIRDNHIHLDQ